MKYIKSFILFCLAVIAIPIDMVFNVSIYPLVYLFTKRWYGAGFSKEDPTTSGYLSTFFFKQLLNP